MLNHNQTHFKTTISPAHMGHQPYLHQDVHHYLAGPSGNLIGNPIARDHHRPLIGQTRLTDFTLQRRDGIW